MGHDDAHTQEEGVLKDVLAELDRERSRRAELEAQVRELAEEREARSHPAPAPAVSPSIPHTVFRSMEVQVEGYREIIDALTLSKPAIAAAAAMEKEESMRKGSSPGLGSANVHRKNGPRKTLPLHVVRLLEVLPWDPRAKQHVFAIEEIFEWQVFRDGAWQSHLRFFPNEFKNLHVVKASGSSSSASAKKTNDGIPEGGNIATGGGNKKDRSILFFLAGGEMQSTSSSTSAIAMSRRKAEHRILTNERLTLLYDTDAGYSLPNRDGGVWEWLGSWRIGKHDVEATSAADLDAQKRTDCDEQGWSYVVEPRDFLLGLPDMIWDNAGGDEDTTLVTKSNKNSDSSKNPSGSKSCKRTFRRRRWIRQRVLVDYLHASESTRQYLLLLKENARLSLATSKLSDQLVETKAALTESEEKLMQARDSLRRKDAALKSAGVILEEDSFDNENTENKELLQTKGDYLHLDISNSRSSSMQDAAAFGSKITQWVQAARKTSEDLTSADDESEEASNNGSGHGASSSLLTESSATQQTTPLPQQQPQMDGKFDWKKIGRGQLINKLKTTPNRASGNQLLKKANSGSARNIFRKAGGDVQASSSRGGD